MKSAKKKRNKGPENYFDKEHKASFRKTEENILKNK